MPRFSVKLFHHHDQNKLADCLADNLQRDSSDIFQSQTVIIQSIGISTWLRQRLAERFGVCSGVDFTLPRDFFLEALTIGNGSNSSSKEDLASSPKLADVNSLTWGLFSLLPSLFKGSSEEDSSDIDLTILRRYCMTDHVIDELKLFQFASLLGSLFETYSIYRAELLADWQNKPLSYFKQLPTLEKLQIYLWKKLHNQTGNSLTWGEILAKNSKALEAQSLTKHSLKSPSTVHLFGITHLPPIFADILHALSEFRPIAIYWQNPVATNEGYWEDSPNHKQWILQTISSQSHEIFNPLLATFGKTGREFVSTLYTGTNSNYDLENIQLPSKEPEEVSLNFLSLVQSDILNNTYTPEKLETIEASKDGSLQIHNSFSQLREVESLRLYLLKHLKQHPETDLTDFIILMPRIENYVSSIEAVFGSAESSDPSAIPYRICDRVSPADEPLVETFLNLLQLEQSAFNANAVLGYCESSYFAESFQITENSLQEIDALIRHAGIVWGKNSTHTNELAEIDYTSFHSWKDGLNRLILGLLVQSPENSPASWSDITASPNLNESHLSSLYSLVNLIEALESISVDLLEKRSLKEWVQLCRSYLKLYFIDSQPNQRALQKVNQALDNILQVTVETQFTDTISAPLFHQVLAQQLGSSGSALGFLSGSITFCELKPMRSIPHKVVCILGLNYGEFPRKAAISSLDLMAKNPKIGDRSSRDGDQYSFLEAILSAKEKLYLSYTGQSEKSNSELAPATPLQLLLNRYPALKKAEMKHPLHRHDPVYFKENAHQSSASQLLSPDSDDLTLALFAHSHSESSLSEPLLKTKEENISNLLELNEFTSFFTHFSSRKIDLLAQAKTPWKEGKYDDNEILEAAGLTQYQLIQFLAYTSLTKDDAYQYLLQNNLLPYGQNGVLKFEEIHQAIQLTKDSLLPTTALELDLNLDQLQLNGVLSPLAQDHTQLEIPLYKKFNAKSGVKLNDLLTLYIQGCCLAVHLQQDVTAKYIYLEALTPIKASLELSLEDAEAALLIFEKIYFRAANENIALLPDSLSTYLKFFKKEESLEAPYLRQYYRDKTYSKQWLSSSNSRGEDQDLKNLLLFDHSAPYNEAFSEIATLLSSLKIL
ncbi:exodeoxyribonuclease V subunit gamma [Akkermansiaceae bacterium]|nr:exodeoxyribonuclease V subunit gamma [Akkermansiaceae bacterium]